MTWICHCIPTRMNIYSLDSKQTPVVPLELQVEMVEMDYQSLPVHLENQALPVSWLQIAYV